jgi:hypothetical protein
MFLYLTPTLRHRECREDEIFLRCEAMFVERLIKNLTLGLSRRACKHDSKTGSPFPRRGDLLDL